MAKDPIELDLEDFGIYFCCLTGITRLSDKHNKLEYTSF